jgi:DNA-binding NarL/FixJ family response regulator
MAKKTAERNGSGKIRVLLASASAVRRAGLEAILKSAATLNLVGSVQGTQTATQRAVALQADALLADFENESSLPPDTSGSVPIVALIDHPQPAWVAHAIRSGVKAILGRDSGGEEILSAITAAYNGFIFLEPTLAMSLVEQVPGRLDHSDSPHENLTPREVEVLSMLAEGLGNREIATRLSISDHTIKYHISSILDKLGASTRTEAVTTGLRLGLILL